MSIFSAKMNSISVHVIVLFFFSMVASAQCPPGSVTFQNQAQVDYFITQYPNCTQINGNLNVETSAGGGAIMNFNGLHNITTISGSINIQENTILVPTMNGLDNLTHVGGSINIVDTYMTSISGLRNVAYVGGDVNITYNTISNFSALNNIMHIGGSLKLSNDDDYCVNSGLVLQVTDIPGNLDIHRLGSQDNNLNSYASITHVGGDFKIDYNSNITSFAGLGALQSVDGVLSIAGCNHLNNLNGLNSLTTLGGILIDSGCNNFSSLAALHQITALPLGIYITYPELLTSLSGLENVTSIGTILSLGSSGLTSIEAISGAGFDNLQQLTILGNPHLSLCQNLNICNYIFNDGVCNISGNAPGCTTIEDLTESCNIRWKNMIKGNLLVDYENNGCGIGTDFPVAGAVVKASTLFDGAYTTFADANGNYKLFVPEGYYTLQTVAANFTSTPANYTVQFSGIGNQAIRDFCSAPSQSFNDVKVDVWPSHASRPGFNTKFYIKYTNKGSTVMSGTVSFTFDSAMMELLSSSDIPASQNAGVMTWNYENLYPFQSRTIVLNFSVMQPPTVNMNDIIHTTAMITPIAADITPANNIYSLNQTVVNAFDPNDKTALCGDVVLINNISNPIDYMIRFQNTGNAPAVNIKVIDTLQTKLNPGTFELVALSHPGRVQLRGYVAEFTFDDINLPGSMTDEPNSHGYAVFRVKPLNTVAIGNTIENEASIYFDYNAPIITNTSSIYIDADSDNDTILDSVDNCITAANTDQSDTDNDGIGDVCDDGIEVNPPYAIGFDTATLDPLWRGYRQSTTTNTYFEVSNLFDVSGSGNTIKLYSYQPSLKVMLISPRLNNVSNSSAISFWIKSVATSIYSVEVGFMTNPNNPATFTKLKSITPTSAMSLYNLNMATYNPAYGKYLAIKVIDRTVYIDDFSYNVTLATHANEVHPFSVYPNPVSGELNLAGNKNIDSVLIYDIHGRKLKTIIPEVTDQPLQIDVNDLSQGMYLIEIQSDKEKFTQKFIKQ